MELRTMSKADFEKAIAAQTAVSMALEYLDECEGQPDAEWLRFILMGCPMEPWQEEILREDDCPEESWGKKMAPRTAMRDAEEETDLEQI